MLLFGYREGLVSSQEAQDVKLLSYTFKKHKHIHRPGVVVSN